MMWRKFSVSEFIRQNIVQMLPRLRLRCQHACNRIPILPVSEQRLATLALSLAIAFHSKPKKNQTEFQAQCKLAAKGLETVTKRSNNVRMPRSPIWTPWQPCGLLWYPSGYESAQLFEWAIHILHSYFFFFTFFHEAFSAEFLCLAKVQLKLTTENLFFLFRNPTLLSRQCYRSWVFTKLVQGSHSARSQKITHWNCVNCSSKRQLHRCVSGYKPELSDVDVTELDFILSLRCLRGEKQQLY